MGYNIKLLSENGRTMKAVCSHYGRRTWGKGTTLKNTGKGVKGSHGWLDIKPHLTKEPIMEFKNKQVNHVRSTKQN